MDLISSETTFLWTPKDPKNLKNNEINMKPGNSQNFGTKACNLGF
jgi:hypothetical protein